MIGRGASCQKDVKELQKRCKFPNKKQTWMRRLPLAPYRVRSAGFPKTPHPVPLPIRWGEGGFQVGSVEYVSHLSLVVVPSCVHLDVLLNFGSSFSRFSLACLKWAKVTTSQHGKASG